MKDFIFNFQSCLQSEYLCFNLTGFLLESLLEMLNVDGRRDWELGAKSGTYPDAGPEDGNERETAGALQTHHWLRSLFRGGPAHPLRLSSLGGGTSDITPPLAPLGRADYPPSQHLWKTGRFYRGPHLGPLSVRLIEN